MFVKRILSEFSFIKGNLLVLLVTWTLFNFTYSMTFPYFSPFLRELGATPSIIGLISAVGTFMLVIVRIPGSHIADKYGRKQIIVSMTFGVAFSMIFFVIAPDWRFILIGLILSNLCLIYQPALEAIEADSIPAELRGVGFSLMRVIPSAFSIASPIIAGYLVGLYDIVGGMRIIYLLVVIASFAAAFIRLFLLQETLDNPLPLTINGFISSYRESISSIIDAWRVVPRNLKILTVIMLVTAIEDPIFMQYASLYVLDVVSIPEDQWGYVFTIYIIIALLLAWPAGKFVDKYGRKFSFIVGFLVGFPATYFFIVSKNIIHLAIVLALYAIVGTLLGPAFQAFITDLTPKEYRGRVFGLIGTLNLVGTIPASIIGGILYELSPSLPFYLLLAVDIILIFLIYLFVEEPQNIS